jgi:hypothetical protein
LTPIDLAIEFVKFTNKSVFLTGKAGTGKTTLLQSIRSQCSKKLLVLAPTGISAVNADGITIHSFFQFPLTVLDHSFFQQPPTEYNENKKEVIENLELLIIDEISMVRADIIDGIDWALRHYRGEPSLPFGGVQLLLIGDLLQLPPVLTDQDIVRMNKLYKSPFFFDARVFEQFDLLTIELTQIYRQNQGPFIELLNNVRNNICTDNDIEWLNRRVLKELASLNSDHIILTTHKAKADSINKKLLAQLSSPQVIIEALVSGEFPESSNPAPRHLEIKEGAQVIFIKNDTANKDYYNGKLGIVHHIATDRLEIKVEGGNIIELERASWFTRSVNVDKTSGQFQDTEQGSFKQFPIKLAWAVTIHKSQGMTFERAIIDATDSFAPGQVYVALSRLKTIEGLVLQNPINKEAIKCDKRVVEYYQRMINNDRVLKMLDNEQELFKQELILKRLRFNNLQRALKKISNSKKQISQVQEYLVVTEELVGISTKFEIQLKSLLPTSQGSRYKLVTERLIKAIHYYQEEIENRLIGPLQQYAVSLTPIKKNEPIIDELASLLKCFVSQKNEIGSVLTLIEGLTQGEAPAALLKRLNEQRTLAVEVPLKVQEKKAVQKGSVNNASLTLFKKGHNIHEIAQKRNLHPGVIEEHLSQFIKTGDISVTDLVSQDKIDIIKILHAKNPSWSIHELRLELGTGFSFGEIRAVLASL